MPDPNVIAYRIVQGMTGQLPEEPPADAGKNPHAVALGRMGGLKGGKARAMALSAEKRRSIAKKAAAARWKRK